ncbi:hypothetical protein UlMin_010413 [Ulmus minor]
MEAVHSEEKPKQNLNTTMSDWDEPFTEDDLEAIEAALQSAASSSSSLSKKPRTNQDSHTARRRLPNSILALQHPNSFSLSPCQVSSRMRLPVMKFGGQITYSRTAAEVERAAMELLRNFEAKKEQMGQAAAVGFDIEWKATFMKGASPGKAAVMQICTDTRHCHVMHIVHSGITKHLQLLLENSMLVKVGVGIGNDAVKVFKDYNVSVKAVEDLSFLANQKLGGDSQKWSLGALTEMLISKQLLKSKRIQLGNWETDFLSVDQLEYAATDAYASWYLYEVLQTLPDVDKVEADTRDPELEVRQQIHC